MAFLTETQVREVARTASSRAAKNNSRLLIETANRATATDRFDIFLSHSIRDAELVHGTVKVLEQRGYSVYVDWLVDPELDRRNVNASTARRLRLRIGQSATLLYLHSENSRQSAWMPWELGYADGLHGRVAILPVLASSTQQFTGVEYLGIYPYIDITVSSLWVHQSASAYRNFGQWKQTPRPDLNPV